MKPELAKQRQKLRFWVLIMICFSLVVYASTFIFDIPALLKQDIIEHFSPIYGEQKTNFYFSFLYSFYSIPNIILPIFGGILSDKYGYRLMSMIFMTLIVLGQGMIYFGCHMDDLRVMILGRFLFGLGGESLGITSSILQVVWFSGKELTFAMAIILSLVRTATVLNTILTPKLTAIKGMNIAFGFGFFLTLFSFVDLIILNKIDADMEKKMGAQKKENDEPLNLIETLKNMIKTLKTFPRMYYIIVFLITSFNATMFNFISFSSPLITDLWLSNDEDPKVNEEIAGRLMGLPYICCTFLAPMIGLFVDAYGQRTKIIIISCFSLFFGLLSILYIYPICTMVLLGFGYSLFAIVVWATITFIVPDNQLGAAFGFIASMCNLASVIVPIVIAIIANFGNSVTIVMFFMILSLVASLLSIIFFMEDKKRTISLDSKNQDSLQKFLNDSIKQQQSQKQQEQENENLIDAV